MTNTTPKKADSKAFAEAEKILVQALSKNDKVAQAFLTNFLSPTERIMLIKRFAAVWLFQNNYSQYKVWNILFISPTTAQRIYTQYQGGLYDEFLNSLSSRKTNEFLLLINDLIVAQASPKARVRLTKRALKN